MFEDLRMVQMASNVARHATVRHRVVAENIANADTPGYRARDVQSFANYVNESFTARANRPEHTGSLHLDPAAMRTKEFEVRTMQASPNDNSVSLEDEIVKSTETRGQHAMALAVYRKTAEFLKTSLGRL